MNKTLIYVTVFICAMAMGIGIVSIFNKEATTVKQEQTDLEIWTCTMHPEIRQEEPGMCSKCNMELTPLNQDTSSLDSKEYHIKDQPLTFASVETIVI